MLERRDAAALHRRALGHRADLEPDDLRQGDLRRRRLRRADRRAAPSRAVDRRSSSSSWRSPTCATPPTSSPTSTSAPRRRRLGLARGLAAARRRHRGDDRAGRSSSTPRASGDNLFIKIPGTEAGLRGDRGVDLRRHPDQRHPALLDRAVPRPRPTPTCAGSSAGSRPGSTRTSPRSPRSSSAAGTSRSPTRCRTSCATGSGSRSASTPTAPTASCSTPTAGSGSPNEGARPQRLLWASTGTKDPEASDTLYIEALRRAVHGQHDARARRCRPSPTTARSASRCPADGGDAEEVLAEFAEAGHRRRRARAAAPEGGRGGLRQVLGRAARDDRVRAERGAPSVGLRVAARVSAEPQLRDRRPAWQALEAHYGEIARRAPARPLRRRPRARRAAASPRAPASTSTSRRTGSPTRRCCCSSSSPSERGVAERRDAMFARRAHQRLRGPRRAPRRAADAARAAR